MEVKFVSKVLTSAIQSLQCTRVLILKTSVQCRDCLLHLCLYVYMFINKWKRCCKVTQGRSVQFGCRKKAKSSTGGVGRRYNSPLCCKKVKTYNWWSGSVLGTILHWAAKQFKVTTGVGRGTIFHWARAFLHCKKWKVTTGPVQLVEWDSVQFACLSAPPAHCPPPANGTARHASCKKLNIQISANKSSKQDKLKGYKQVFLHMLPHIVCLIGW